jgi:hypothetical protein
MKLSTGPSSKYELHSLLILRFENNSGGEIVAKSLDVDLRLRTWYGDRSCGAPKIGLSIATQEVGTKISTSDALVSWVDINILPKISTYSVIARHVLPDNIDPSDLGKRHYVRLTFDLMGRPKQAIDWPIQWPTAIRTLDPYIFSTETSRSQIKRHL